MKNWKTPQLKDLAKVIKRIDSQPHMMKFLRDLLTLEELEEVSSRWEVVQLLEKGKSYREIAAKTGVSTTTITRIAHYLHHGEGGYKTALKQKKK